MAASLHLARYSPAGAVRMLRAMRRYGSALRATPGLSVTSLFFTTELVTSTGGMPTPTRWALFCGWEDAGPRDEFLDDPRALGPFRADAKEYWSVSLDTVRLLMGEWRGWAPATEGVEPLARDEPLAVMTYGKLRPRYVPTFLYNNRKAVRQVARQPGLVARIGLNDHPLAACTFSLWRSQGDVVRFAYGAGNHKPIQRRSLDVPWGHEYFFARFRPVASTGTWDDRDPLAGLLPAAAPAAAPKAAA